MRYWLVMPAAGSGSRFRAASPKQYAALAGRTVIEWALAPFLTDWRCAGIVVALAPQDGEWPRIAARLLPAQDGVAPGASSPPPLTAVGGGAHRSLSVRAALAALSGRAAAEDWVLVHDAARPCLESGDLERLLAVLAPHPLGGLLATAAADTLKRAPAAAARDTGARVCETVDRSLLWRALTPQMFRYAKLCAALDDAHAAQRYPTDEAQALEWQGEQPLLIPGAASNLKITTAEDLVLAAAILRSRHISQARGAPMRIGSGFDVHAFGPGDFLMLGGVRIPHSRGVVAHSDGDVVLHALCDALLGAAGLGDIGQHFADTDPRWRGADSRRFIAAVLAMLRERGLAVANVDVTVLAQSPKIAPHRDTMRQEIARLLGIGEPCVNIKATTTEGLGFLGRAEGIAAQAVVLLTESAPWGPQS
jgi:2-C-methyl-D-erythritol 2,4-cyclodiphosphate synthase/2-C-methyl-D-erythritol 4-phosphate cytidylyltransferase